MRRKIVNLPKLASLGMAVLLVACANAPPAVQHVEIPVFSPCVKTAVQRPVYEFDKLPSTATDGEIILALMRDWLRGREYEGEVEAVIAGCVPAEQNTERRLPLLKQRQSASARWPGQ